MFLSYIILHPARWTLAAFGISQQHLLIPSMLGWICTFLEFQLLEEDDDSMTSDMKTKYGKHYPARAFSYLNPSSSSLDSHWQTDSFKCKRRERLNNWHRALLLDHPGLAVTLITLEAEKQWGVTRHMVADHSDNLKHNDFSDFSCLWHQQSAVSTFSTRGHQVTIYDFLWP